MVGLEHPTSCLRGGVVTTSQQLRIKFIDKSRACLRDELEIGAVPETYSDLMTRKLRSHALEGDSGYVVHVCVADAEVLDEI